uniref:BZIP domain-containing protein n=1 Tax=Entomoneis paludosa TaxID=265537 RepID=A0A6U3AVR3_9STRA|mmetsp:Transcript_27396/g.57357  ORF Transcript_27396/g.57357 Transcript_27396/m.57357 type:complete len:493 (+) Transcript_27396:44-1522(+)
MDTMFSNGNTNVNWVSDSNGLVAPVYAEGNEAVMAVAAAGTESGALGGSSPAFDDHSALFAASTANGRRMATMGVDQTGGATSNIPRVASETDRQQEALRHFDEAMASIPLHEKIDYLEAVKQAPEVVREETHPLKFLRFCDYNTWNAATRMATYWRERKAAFEERAFLPLTLNKERIGGSALNDTDILSLQAAFVSILPPTESGRQVILFDRSQNLASADGRNRLRGVFYVGHILAQDESAQTEQGTVLCFLMTIKPRLQDLDHVMNKKLWYLVDAAFPIRLQFHSCCFVPKTMRGLVPTAEGDLVSKTALMANLVSEHFGLRISGLSRVNLHFETQEGEICKMMLDKGLNLRGIPNFIGGSWSFSQARTWCEQQAVRERNADQQRIALDEQRLQASFISSLLNDERHGKSPTEASSGERGEDSIDHCRERRKAANVLHSRRKRERRRQEQNTLVEESDRLTRHNEALKREQDRLEKLLGRATQMVEDFPF